MVRRGIGVLLALTLSSCGVFALGDLVPPDDAGPPDARTDGSAGSDGAPCADPDPCTCLAPAETIVKEPNGSGEGIAVSATDVYFLVSKGNNSDVTVWRAPLGSIDAAAPVQMSASYPGTGPLVLGGDAVYFKRIGTGWSILRVPLDTVGAPPIVLNGATALASAPNDLGADATNVYWSNTNGQICAYPLAAPPAADAGDGGCIGAPVVAARDGGGPSQSMALSATDVFWLSYSRIFRAPLASGSPITQLLAQNPDSLGGLAESQGQIFWSRVGSDAGAIYAAADDGTGAQKVVVSPFADHSITPTFAVDGDGIYWGARLSQQVFASNRDGSARRLVACDTGVSAITTDANFVYWITPGGGVKRLAKR